MKTAERAFGSLACALYLIASVGSAVHASTETLIALGDTHVRSANPGANFGDWSTNMIGREASKGGDEPVKTRALFQFDTSTIPTGAIIRHAAVRIYIENIVENPADPGPLDITAWPLDGSFVEGDGTSGVTWNTQPAKVAWPNHTSAMTALAAEWFEMDVTRLVKTGLAGADPENLWVLIGPTEETTNETRHIFFRTREHGSGAEAPRLAVDYETGATLVVIIAAAEAPVSSYQPDTNLGANLYSWIFRSGSAVIRSLSHFAIGSIPSNATVLHAEVHLSVGPTWVENPLQLGGVEARRLTTGFVESSVTWNNQPAVFASPTGYSNLGPAPNQTFEINVTSIVEDVRGGGDPTNVWMRLAAFDEVTPVLSTLPFRSDEWVGQEPKLIVYYSAATPTPVPTATGTPVPTATQTPTPIFTPAATSTPTEIGGTPVIEEVSPANDLTAPEIDQTVITDLATSVEFLYDGPEAVQSGVEPGAIDARRVAVLRGKVRDDSSV